MLQWLCFKDYFTVGNIDFVLFVNDTFGPFLTLKTGGLFSRPHQKLLLRPKRESHHHHKSGNEVEKAVVHVIANEILIITEVVIHVWPQFPYLHLCRSRKFFSWLWWFWTWWLSKTELKIEFAREERCLKGFSQALVFHVVAEKGWLWSFHYQLLLPPSKFPQGDATAFSFLYTVNRDSRSKCW